MAEPLLKKPIPPQIINEGASFGPLDLTEFISDANRFSAALDNDQPLPKGLICTSEGVISGIPAKGTRGLHKVVVTAEDIDGNKISQEFDFTIKKALTQTNPDLYNKLKAEVWEAIGHNLPLPEMEDIFNRPITDAEIYYLLQRFATLTIWDVYNLDYPGEKKILTLPDSSPHYNIYDRGSCIVGAPKDLFSYERTLEDALQTARAMAREVYRRNWVIEFTGFEKMIRAGWIELQIQGDKNGKYLEVLHFSPSPSDVKLYTTKAQAIQRSL